MEREPHAAALGAYARWAKRCFDVGVSLAALTALAPVALGVAAFVRATMGAPVLFRQVRPGRGGRAFSILKFRTMTDARGPDGELLPDAQRLPRFGLLLRKSSLDELPQLLNVLRGEMSLVGPRPLLFRYEPVYTPRERTRGDVRPGITGWAQVNGRNALSWSRRLELDAWYVENLSFALDLRILVATLGKVLRRADVQADASLTFLDHERRGAGAEAALQCERPRAA
jgi:lipopolysaccharide/colanic/teichoic acid biosynthesis glycosyltransferase